MAALATTSEAARNRRARALEDATERNVEVFAIVRPEPGIDAHHDSVVGVEPEPEAVVGLEIPEIEVRSPQRDLAGIVKERAVERGPDLITVFRLKQQCMRSAEPILPEPAQRIV